MTANNSLFANMPIVSIVTQVKNVNGVMVESPINDCIRVWGRIGVGTRLDPTINHPLIDSRNVRVTPDPQGIDKLTPF